MNRLGNGLAEAKHHEDALSVQEAELAMKRRVGASEDEILITQSNLANSYDQLGRSEEALSMRRDIYSGRLKLSGEEHERTLRAASNYAASLARLRQSKEAKSLLRKTIPAARRILGESNQITLHLRCNYALALYEDPAATLDDLREAVTTLEEIETTARRVLGGAKPLTVAIERELQQSREVLQIAQRRQNV
jgi:hypothetical protein